MSNRITDAEWPAYLQHCFENHGLVQVNLKQNRNHPPELVQLWLDRSGTPHMHLPSHRLDEWMTREGIADLCLALKALGAVVEARQAQSEKTKAQVKEEHMREPDAPPMC